MSSLLFVVVAVLTVAFIILHAAVVYGLIVVPALGLYLRGMMGLVVGTVLGVVVGSGVVVVVTVGTTDTGCRENTGI